jgi:hypothetical protein
MSTNVYTALNTFSFIRKHFLQICVRKVAVHLNMLEVMSTNVYTGLNQFNFIRKHILQKCTQKVAVHLKGVGSDVHECLYRPESAPYRRLSAQRLSELTVPTLICPQGITVITHDLLHS